MDPGQMPSTQDRHHGPRTDAMDSGQTAQPCFSAVRQRWRYPGLQGPFTTSTEPPTCPGDRGDLSQAPAPLQQHLTRLGVTIRDKPSPAAP